MKNFGWERGNQVYYVQQEDFRVFILDWQEDLTSSLLM